MKYGVILLAIASICAAEEDEPRCTITNKQSEYLLYNTGVVPPGKTGWEAKLSREAERDKALFKVQTRFIQAYGIASTLLIRTDQHPQSLLDRKSRPLAFEGEALDPDKCNVRARWYEVIYTKVTETSVEVAFKAKDTDLYLADLGGREHKLGLITVPGNTKVQSIPINAQWVIHRSGGAPPISEVGDIVLFLVETILEALSPAGFRNAIKGQSKEALIRATKYFFVKWNE